jgi:hypothetical protein
VAHRTVRCTTGHCPVLIAFLFWRSRPLKIWSRWRTGQCLVHTGQSGAPFWPLAQPRVTRGLRGRPLDRPTVGSPDSPVHHRTVRWIIAVRRWSLPESDDFTVDGSPDSLVYHRTVRWFIVVHRRRVPRADCSPRLVLAHRTLSGAPPDSLVHPDRSCL